MPPIKFIFFMITVAALMIVIASVGQGTLDGANNLTALGQSSDALGFIGTIKSLFTDPHPEIFEGWAGGILRVMIIAPIAIILVVIGYNIVRGRSTTYD